MRKNASAFSFLLLQFFLRSQNRAMLSNVRQRNTPISNRRQYRANVSGLRYNIWSMNTQLLENRWTALVFGAVFSLLTSTVDGGLIYYAIKSLIGGGIWFGFQVLADRLKKRSEAAEQQQQNKPQDNGSGKVDSTDRAGK